MKIEIMWEQLRGAGLEHLVLLTDHRVEADGLALGRLGDTPYRIHYRITCDRDWNVERLFARNLLNDHDINMTRRNRDWIDAQGNPLTAMRGCTDVDIMVTPFTNTLPIRRIGLQPGQSADITALYVRAPDLALTPVEQRYTCLSRSADEALYRYISLASGFTADLLTDGDGLVREYPGVFRAIWKQADP